MTPGEQISSVLLHQWRATLVGRTEPNPAGCYFVKPWFSISTFFSWEEWEEAERFVHVVYERPLDVEIRQENYWIVPFCRWRCSEMVGFAGTRCTRWPEARSPSHSGTISWRRFQNSWRICPFELGSPISTIRRLLQLVLPLLLRRGSVDEVEFGPFQTSRPPTAIYKMSKNPRLAEPTSLLGIDGRPDVKSR